MNKNGKIINVAVKFGNTQLAISNSDKNIEITLDRNVVEANGSRYEIIDFCKNVIKMLELDEDEEEIEEGTLHNCGNKHCTYIGLFDCECGEENEWGYNCEECEDNIVCCRCLKEGQRCKQCNDEEQ